MIPLPKFIKNHILKGPRQSFIKSGFDLQSDELRSTFERILKTDSEMRSASLQLVGFTLAMLALIREDGAIPENLRLASSFLLIFSGLMPVIIFLIYYTEKAYLMKKRDWDEKGAKLYLQAQIKSGFLEIPGKVWEEFEPNLKKLDEEKPSEPHKYWVGFLTISSFLLWGIFFLGIVQLFLHF